MINWLKVPINRVKAATALLCISLVAWPLTSLTVFRGEPQGVLALSWAAIILTCLDIIVTTETRTKL